MDNIGQREKDFDAGLVSIESTLIMRAPAIPMFHSSLRLGGLAKLEL
jgi:hypothetical protein